MVAAVGKMVTFYLFFADCTKFFGGIFHAGDEIYNFILINRKF